MSISKDFDYKNTHFEFPELTKIHGEPSTQSLITLQREIRANADSVNTTLGGGSLGHLGLVCSDATYALIPGSSPYIRPVLPTVVTMDSSATQFQIAQSNEIYKENLRLFREMLAVERTIIQQIVAAVDGKFLSAIRNTHTNKINKSIPEILEYLFDTYGDVTISELVELQNTVQTMVFNPKEPIDVVFTEIADLADIATIAKSPMTTQQKINMAYIILQRTNTFKSGLRKWNEKAANLKTWENCKQHFRDVQKNLRKTGSLTVEEGINHTELINMVSEGVRNAMAAEPKENVELANLAQENLDVKKQLADMKLLINQMKNQSVMQVTPQPHQQFNQQQMFNPYTGQPVLQNNGRWKNGPANSGGRKKYVGTDYCWTHGWCRHSGKNCTNRMQGHQEQATKENNMGGNPKRCNQK